jgi:iron(III) transport system permease protein
MLKKVGQMQRPKSAARAATWLLFLALLVSVTAVMFAVLNESLIKDGSPTFEVITEAFSAPGVAGILRNTLVVVVVSGLGATVVGTFLAIVATKLDVKWQRLFASIPLVPLTIAPLVGAIGWVFLLAPNTGWLNAGIRLFTGGDEGPFNIFSLWGVVWVTTLYVIPYVFTTMSAALQRMNSETLEAFMVNGTGRLGSVRRVVTGVLRPALIAGLILAVLESIIQFSIPLILDVDVLTTSIYRYTQLSFPIRRDLAAALALLLLIFGVALTLAELRILGRRRYTSVAGRGLSQRTWSFGRVTDRVLKAMAVGYLLASTILPLSAILLVSFQPFWKPDFVLGDLTLDNYVDLFNSSNFRAGLSNSLRLALASAVAIVLLALIISIVRSRMRDRLGEGLYVVGNVPLGIPGVVFGLGLLIVFINGPFRLYGTLLALGLAYVLHFLPLGIRNIDPVVRQVGYELQEAASVSGAQPWRVIKDVTIPLVMPGITAAASLVLILVLREFPMSALLSTPTTKVVSVYLVDTFENGVFPQVAAMAVGLSVVSILAVLVFQWVNRKVRFGAAPAKRRRRPPAAPVPVSLAVTPLAPAPPVAVGASSAAPIQRSGGDVLP